MNMIGKYLLLICFLAKSTYAAKPLKVLFVTDIFPFQIRQYIDNQIVGLINKNVEVTILAECLSDYPDYSTAKEYNFEKITFYNDLPADKKSFDIIYCQFSNVTLKMLEKRKNNQISGKIVCCFRGGNEFALLEKNIKEYEFIFNNVDLVLPVCKAFKKRLIAYGCPAEKIIVHHSAINIDDFTYKERLFPADGKIKIITIGRLHSMKGHSYLIEAIAKVKEIYPFIEYNIYGVGPLYQKLSEKIKLHNLENTVFLKGYCDHDLISNILSEHHLFILGSYTMQIGSQEGIPNVLMEALATGMPVIATKHSGIPELIKDTVTGFIVKERNIFEMAEKIVYLIKHPKIWKNLGKSARKKVMMEHCREKQNKKLLDFFENLVSA